MALRILVTGRDPGGAWQNRAFVEECHDRGYDVDFRFVCNVPAIGIVRELPYPAEEIPLVENGDEESVMAHAHRSLVQFDPHVVLVGLSYPGFQIDEAMVRAARQRSIPSVTIQDYWGSTGSFKDGELPDIYFVLDTLAARWTSELTSGRSRTCVVGSPRHWRWSGPAAERISSSSALPEAGGVVALFTQPRDTPGVLENLKAFIEAWPEASPEGARLRLRLHPKEQADVSFYTTLATQAGVSIELVPASESLETTLGSCSAVVSCFSSVATDHHFLQLFCPRPLGGVIFLSIGTALREFLRTQTPDGMLPSVLLGLARVVSNTSEIASALRGVLNVRSAEEYRQKVLQTFSRAGDPAGKIWQEILQICDFSPLTS